MGNLRGGLIGLALLCQGCALRGAAKAVAAAKDPVLGVANGTTTPEKAQQIAAVAHTVSTYGLLGWMTATGIILIAAGAFMVWESAVKLGGGIIAAGVTLVACSAAYAVLLPYQNWIVGAGLLLGLFAVAYHLEHNRPAVAVPAPTGTK